jgi:2-amino-4-hydroxy-6-hydroxymethyldihydropteridine diphosphokinase
MLTSSDECIRSMTSFHSGTATLVALGSNMSSSFGGPTTNVRCGLDHLRSRGIVPLVVSRIYQSAPLGSVRQAHYANAVAVVECALPVGQMMRVIKQIERQMGRRTGVRWGPRPLDIDILAHRGQMATGAALGWVGRVARPTSRKRGQAVLPHPEIQNRIFVLQPLCDIAPQWVHPVFNKTAKQLFHIIRAHEANLLQQTKNTSSHS